MALTLKRLARTAALLALGVSMPTLAAAPTTPRPPLEAYGNLPEIEDVAISSSGVRTALLGTFNGKRSVVALDADGKLLVNVAVGDAKVRRIEWAGDDFILLYFTTTTNLKEGFSRDRIEATSGLIVPADGTTPQRIFGDSSRIVNAIMGRYGVRRVDGRWTGFFGGYEFKRSNGNVHERLDQGAGELVNRTVLFGVDLKTNSASRVATAAREGYWRDWLVDAAGQPAVTLEYDETAKTWRISALDGHTIARGEAVNDDTQLIAFGPQGNSVIYGQSDRENIQRWYEVPLSGGPVQEFLADVGVESFYLNPLTGVLIGYRESGNDGARHFFAPENQAVITKIMKAFPGLHVSVEGWTADLRQVLVHTSGNKDSGTWYQVDLSNLHARAAGYDYIPIGPEWVGPISRIEYRAADGLAMDGILTLPPGREAKNLPVVLLPHGGPNAYDSAAFDWWAQAFASRGYAVFQPNFRGSTNRGADFERAGENQWGRKMQTDISDGLAELARQGIVDPKRACIVGGSYGGYAALAGVTLQKNVYRCAVAVAPVSDLWQMYHEDNATSGYSDATWRYLKRTLGPTSGYADISPSRHADQASAPILLIHGLDDTRVPIGQSETMANALKNAGKPFEFIKLAGEDHFLSHSATRQQMLTAAMDFVQKYNPAD